MKDELTPASWKIVIRYINYMLDRGYISFGDKVLLDEDNAEYIDASFPLDIAEKRYDEKYVKCCNDIQNGISAAKGNATMYHNMKNAIQNELHHLNIVVRRIHQWSRNERHICRLKVK